MSGTGKHRLIRLQSGVLSWQERIQHKISARNIRDHLQQEVNGSHEEEKKHWSGTRNRNSSPGLSSCASTNTLVGKNRKLDHDTKKKNKNTFSTLLVLIGEIVEISREIQINLGSNCTNFLNQLSAYKISIFSPTDPPAVYYLLYSGLQVLMLWSEWKQGGRTHSVYHS